MYQNNSLSVMMAVFFEMVSFNLICEKLLLAFSDENIAMDPKFLVHLSVRGTG